MDEANKTYAVVTGANKGIGFEICKQLASNGIVVILTARDEKRGLEAVEKLKEHGFSDRLVFHQLDVADAASVASLARFIATQFGKLDILVNNAGVGGAKVDEDALKASSFDGSLVNWKEITTQTYELAKECLEINYYGAKRMTEALVPILKLSDSARIVNVSSTMGTLKNVSPEWAQQALRDEENLTDETVDEVLNAYLKDFKEGLLESKGWPAVLFPYVLSKAALNAYTRILAKKYPSFCVNSVCPGFTKTDLNFNTGRLTVYEGAESPVRLALLPNGGPSGCFFDRKELAPF